MFIVSHRILSLQRSENDNDPSLVRNLLHNNISSVPKDFDLRHLPHFLFEQYAIHCHCIQLYTFSGVGPKNVYCTILNRQ